MNRQQILSEADHCVKCGLCLPHCPTYQVTGDEGDSPRGRIALIQAIAEGVLDSPRANDHLDRCLGCRNCETACPSGVSYGELLDSIRQLSPPTRDHDSSTLLRLLPGLAHNSLSIPALRAYQKSGARKLARRIGGERFRRLDQLLPTLDSPRQTKPLYQATGATRGRVGLFTGCVGRITDMSAIDSAIRVLTHLGLEVAVPEEQVCCGAMDQHDGRQEKSAQLALKNQEAFGGLQLDALITLASGCGGQLKEQGEKGQLQTAPVMDFSHFIMQLQDPHAVRLEPSDARLLLHTPCSLKNVMRCPDEPRRMLELIPGLRIEELPSGGCCGGAGSFMLTQPELAESLRSPLVESIAQSAPDFVVTSNTGCALHLRTGLEQAGISTPVVHPAELIARQLPSGEK
ncbi:MAG: (Fe-S)-binding protein [Sedimenticola sp.]